MSLRLNPEESKVENDTAASVAQNPFTLSAISDMHSSRFVVQGFSSAQRLVVVRALLRYGAHRDGTHYHTKSQDGLHPAYVAFNPIQKSVQKSLTRTGLVEASLGDVFDAVRLISIEWWATQLTIYARFLCKTV